jgi:hypothetical protein
MDNPDLNETLA